MNEVTRAVIVKGAFVAKRIGRAGGVFTSSGSFGVGDIKAFKADISVVTVEI
jgi:hypothetical protein